MQSSQQVVKIVVGLNRDPCVFKSSEMAGEPLVFKDIVSSERLSSCSLQNFFRIGLNCALIHL